MSEIMPVAAVLSVNYMCKLFLQSGRSFVKGAIVHINCKKRFTCLCPRVQKAYEMHTDLILSHFTFLSCYIKRSAMLDAAA